MSKLDQAAKLIAQHMQELGQDFDYEGFMDAFGQIEQQLAENAQAYYLEE